jgi:16S rRNA (guanine(966)-N(2))-methyltransferase RsmD
MQNKPIKKTGAVAAGRAAPASKGQAHQVRIIGGQWKRTPLAVPDAQGLRPTPDRVRETVFNWLNHLLEGDWQNRHCLDLFAGSGALGFEAASRGAASVTMVETNSTAIRHLETAKEKLKAGQVRILRTDALSALQGTARAASHPGQKFDVIFLDPPYHQGWLAKILPACMSILAEDGLVYVEAEEPLTMESVPEWLHGWDVIRSDKAGVVFYHLLKSIKNA